MDASSSDTVKRIGSALAGALENDAFKSALDARGATTAVLQKAEMTSRWKVLCARQDYVDRTGPTVARRRERRAEVKAQATSQAAQARAAACLQTA